MKYTTKFILGLGLLFMVAQGCNDLLDDPTPSDELSQSVVLNNPGAVEGVRINMYDRLQSGSYTTLYMLGPSALADDFVNLVGSSRYEGLVQNQVGAGLGQYNTTYELIQQANLIISGIPEGVIESQVTLDRYRGEGYFFRAFALHSLAARAYGYEPGATPSSGPGAGFELSVIIQTEPTLGLSDVEEKTRNTASEVYAQLVSDLENAIDLLPDAGAVSSNYVTSAAAEALLARVQLYGRSWSAANTHAQNAIDNSSARMATESEVATMFDETVGANPEAIFILDVDPTVDVVGGSNNLNGYTAGFWNAMIPSKQVLSRYPADDARNAWFGPCFSENKGDCTGDYPGDDSFEAQELQKWNAEQGSQADDIPHFRISELKLIQAEARAMAAGAVTQDAVSALNDVRTNRGLEAATVADYGSVEDFIDDILLERQREFIGEGHRFFDLKRRQRDIQKAAVTPFAPALPFNSFRVLDNFPQDEIDINPALTQNPGY